MQISWIIRQGHSSRLFDKVIKVTRQGQSLKFKVWPWPLAGLLDTWYLLISCKTFEEINKLESSWDEAQTALRFCYEFFDLGTISIVDEQANFARKCINSAGSQMRH